MAQVAHNIEAGAREGTLPAPPSATTVSTPQGGRRGTPRPLHRRHRRRSYWADPALHEAISCPRVKPLGYLTEARLIERAQQGDIAARNTVWRSHLRLAMSAINEFHMPRPLVPDAFQEAAIGLEQAIMRYEVRRFLSFSTYAWYWIVQRVRRLVASQGTPIRIPAHLHRTFAHFCHERKSCRSPGEWFDWFDSWSSREPARFTNLARIYYLAHDPPGEMDLLAHAAGEDRYQPLDADEKRLIRAALRALSKRERSILERRFGLDAQDEVTLETIAQELGVTRERVRQIQEEALRRLGPRLRSIAMGHCWPTVNDDQIGEEGFDSALDPPAPATERRNRVPSTPGFLGSTVVWRKIDGRREFGG